MAKKTESSLIAAPPRISEYLPETIRKTVVRKGMSHPATLYPIALSGGLGFMGWLFGTPILYGAALAGLLFGPLWAIIQIFFLHEKIGSRYIRELNKRQRKHERHIRVLLEKDLRTCTVKGIEDHAIHGIRQLRSIQEKLANVQEVLERKLYKEELTFGRFLGAAEQVSLSVLDNLKDMVSLLKSASSIHPAYIQERLNNLAQTGMQTGQDAKQKAALESRLALREYQLRKVSSLLTKNEEAMTEMEKISAAIAEWQTDSHFANTDFESAISHLHELAEQAHEYN